MSITAISAYEMLKRCGRNRDRYEAIRPDNYPEEEESLSGEDSDEKK
jgi:hypothetical protein